MGKMFVAIFNDGEEKNFNELISFIEKRGYNIFKLSNAFPINYLKVSAKYSCGFSNLLNPSIIVNEI